MIFTVRLEGNPTQIELKQSTSDPTRLAARVVGNRKWRLLKRNDEIGSLTRLVEEGDETED